MRKVFGDLECDVGFNQYPKKSNRGILSNIYTESFIVLIKKSNNTEIGVRSLNAYQTVKNSDTREGFLGCDLILKRFRSSVGEPLPAGEPPSSLP